MTLQGTSSDLKVLTGFRLFSLSIILLLEKFPEVSNRLESAGAVVLKGPEGVLHPHWPPHPLLPQDAPAPQQSGVPTESETQKGKETHRRSWKLEAMLRKSRLEQVAFKEHTLAVHLLGTGWSREKLPPRGRRGWDPRLPFRTVAGTGPYWWTVQPTACP